MAEYIVLNGRITPVEDAGVSSFDAGLLHGALGNGPGNGTGIGLAQFIS